MVLAQYSRHKLLTSAGFLAALSLVCAWLAFGNGDDFGIILPLMFVGFAAGSAKIFSMAFGSLAALEQSPAGLIVHTNWSRKVVPWNEYAGIMVESWWYRAGFIPVWKVHYLLVRQTGGILGTKKIRLTLGFMDLPVVQVRALGDRIDGIALKGGAMPQASAANPVIADAGPKPVDAGFDPDAAIARYMASRPQQADAPAGISPPPAPPPQPARPAFGRKGLSA